MLFCLPLILHFIIDSILDGLLDVVSQFAAAVHLLTDVGAVSVQAYIDLHNCWDETVVHAVPTTDPVAVASVLAASVVQQACSIVALAAVDGGLVVHPYFPIDFEPAEPLLAEW